MKIDYFRCEICGTELMHRNSTNESKFPPVRRPEELSEEDLLSVRCAECAELPYKLSEGQPYRSRVIGKDNVPVVVGYNSIYNYWPNGIGHLLEVFPPSLSEESLSFARSAQIELGFLVDEDVNLIVVAYRFVPNAWETTPYLWHAYKEFARAVPPDDDTSTEARKFTVALVNDEGGKYRAIREGVLSLEFAKAFHNAMRQQIARGLPEREQYRVRVDNLHELLNGNKVDSLLQMRTILQEIS